MQKHVVTASFAAPKRTLSYFYEAKPLLLGRNSYILAPLEKPYISRLPVLPSPLILLIIRLFEIFRGHTGVTTSFIASFLLDCIPVPLPVSFSKTRLKADTNFLIPSLLAMRQINHGQAPKKSVGFPAP